MAEPTGTIAPYEPSPLEKQQQVIANFLLDNGLISDNYRAQRLAENMTFMSELIPGFGDVQGVREGKFMIDEGNPMMGGIMMGASMLPFIPGSALMRKAQKLQAKIKQEKFNEQRELRNAGSGDGNAAYDAAERARKKHQTAQRQLDEMIAKEKAKPNLEPKITTKEPPKAVQQEMDFSSPSIPTSMLREMQDDYIKSRKGPTEIPPVLYDRRSIDDTSLDFDKAFLRGEYTTRGSNPNFNKPGSIQFTGEKLPLRYMYSDSYAKYMNDPKKLKELKLATGPDLRYSTQQDPTLIHDAFSGQYPELKQLFHGSKTKGIKNLELPKSGSSGGIYSLVDPKDPRFKIFSEKGSGYVLQPNFKKTLDVDNMPDDMLKVLQDIEMYRGRPSRGGAKKLDMDLNTLLRGGPGSINKTPSGVDKELADIFTGQGYDALRFPPRGMKGERSTMLSLDPSNLKIVDEIPYEDLDDFIRTLLNDL
jgi:hypothetical protein